MGEIELISVPVSRSGSPSGIAWPHAVPIFFYQKYFELRPSPGGMQTAGAVTDARTCAADGCAESCHPRKPLGPSPPPGQALAGSESPLLGQRVSGVAPGCSHRRLHGFEVRFPFLLQFAVPPLPWTFGCSHLGLL